MAEGQMFKSAMGGYNKHEVNAYIEKLKTEKERNVSVLMDQIKELEKSIITFESTISDKDKQIKNLYIDVEQAQISEGEKFKEISQLMDKMSEAEAALKQKMETMEQDYRSRLNAKEDELEVNLARLEQLEAEGTDKLKNAQNTIAELEQKIAKLESDLEQTKRNEERMSAQYVEKENALVAAHQQEARLEQNLRREFEQKLRENDAKWQERLSTTTKAHEDGIKEMNNKYEVALDSARGEISQIRESLEAARMIEENAKQRSKEMIEETEIKCHNLIEETQNEVNKRRSDALCAIDIEKEQKYAEIMEANREKGAVLAAIKECRMQFVAECNRVEKKLEGGFSEEIV